MLLPLKPNRRNVMSKKADIIITNRLVKRTGSSTMEIDKNFFDDICKVTNYVTVVDKNDHVLDRYIDNKVPNQINVVMDEIRDHDIIISIDTNYNRIIVDCYEYDKVSYVVHNNTVIVKEFDNMFEAVRYAIEHSMFVDIFVYE